MVSREATKRETKGSLGEEMGDKRGKGRMARKL